jgi:hypothetical protein
MFRLLTTTTKINFYSYFLMCSLDCKTHLLRTSLQEAKLPTLRNLCRTHGSFKQANMIIIHNCPCGPSNGIDDAVIEPDVDITWLGS